MAWGLFNKVKSGFKSMAKGVKALGEKVLENSGKIGDVINTFAPGYGDQFKKGAKIAKAVDGIVGDVWKG